MQRGEDGLTEALSRPNTKKGRLQRACLALLREHEADGALPTSIRFLFYELEGRGVIPKAYRKPDGTEGKRKPSQDVSEALTVLRELGSVPWDWIVDESRTLHEWAFADTVSEYMVDQLRYARIGLWGGAPPPLILCESRSLAGVIRNIAGRYLCPIAATNGQTGGFLRTAVGPLIERGFAFTRPVLYFGDLDLSGGHIEDNTRKVLEEYGPLDWRRLAITDVQVREHHLTAIDKPDHRYKPVRSFPAVETEALSQRVIQRILREHLDAMLPEPLADVLAREDEERVLVRELLEVAEEEPEGA
jgi:hypothetical protein